VIKDTAGATRGQPPSSNGNGRHRPEPRDVLRDAVAAIESAAPGKSHDELVSQTQRIAWLIVRGDLDEQEARSGLRAAGERREKPAREIDDALDSALNKAMRAGASLKPASALSKPKKVIDFKPPKKSVYPDLDEAARRTSRALNSPHRGTWIYRDAGGREAMAVVRFGDGDDKQFRPYHPIPGGWIVGDPDGLMPLYHLDALPAAGLVVVCEGEKTTEMVAGLGLTATTSSHGSKAFLKTDWTPLADRDVVILPDHDEPGEKYAAEVSKILAKLSPPARVRVVRLPGLEEKGDVEQWLRDVVPESWTTDECRAELLRLAEQAAPPDEPKPPTAVDVSQEDAPVNRTDLGNARRLVALFGDQLRYCTPWKTWFVWTGARWERDETGQVYQLAKQTVRSIAQEAADEPDDNERKALLRWALASESRKLIENMVALAQSERSVSVRPLGWDADPWAFNVRNGTIDLRSGLLRPHRREDLITMLAPVDFDPEATAPRWEQFEGEVFAGDQDLISYIRRVVGYSMTADMSVQELVLLHGEGSNGKNIFLDSLGDIFGDYACEAEPSLLLQADGERHPTGLMDLFNKRFVAASETEDGKRLAESLMKRLTGNRKLKARRMRENFVTFSRTFKLFIATNHKPEIKGRDHAVWRRIRLVPFITTFAKEGQPIDPPRVLKEDPNLAEKLAAEASGILNLMIAGCLDWQRSGIRPAAAVVAATEEYRSETDSIREWLDECCESFLDHTTLREQARFKASELWESYDSWFKRNGVDGLSKRTFGSEMERRGYKMAKSNSVCWRYGVTLKT
jgi:putative DNA primase/helicase